MITNQKYDLYKLLSHASSSEFIGLLRSGAPTELPTDINELFDSAHATVALSMDRLVIPTGENPTLFEYNQHFCIRQYSGLTSREFDYADGLPEEQYAIMPVSITMPETLLPDSYTGKAWAYMYGRMGIIDHPDEAVMILGDGQFITEYNFGAEFLFRRISWESSSISTNLDQQKLQYQNAEGVWVDIPRTLAQRQMLYVNFRATKLRFVANDAGSVRPRVECWAVKEAQTFVETQITHMVMIPSGAIQAFLEGENSISNYVSLVLMKNTDFRLTNDKTGTGLKPFVHSFSIKCDPTTLVGVHV